jgi:microsomal dipeptidase-like Zn-dependent dipeptidase
MVNVTGLTEDGREYLRHLMAQGMVIGTEHMSRRAVEDAYQVLADQLVEGGQPQCSGLGSGTAPAHCYESAYPLSVSHAHFRRLSLPGGRTSVVGFKASEYEIGDRQTDLIRRTGGVVGQFVSEDPVVLPPGFQPPPFENDCAGSSKSFAVSLWYALHRMNWSGVGLATDFAFIPGAAPRFGPEACSADATSDDRRKERLLFPSQYRRNHQENPVVYRTSNSTDDSALSPYHLGPHRQFDFNKDGFAHYGLLPDLLQDVKNIGLPRRAWESLFSSAESYIQAWEKAVKHSIHHGPGPLQRRR